MNYDLNIVDLFICMEVVIDLQEDRR